MLRDFGLRIRPRDVVVEIGCGVGRMTRALAARAANVQALDVSERMLALAREHNPGLANVDWILGDGRSLVGIPDASADACISIVVFQHIPDPEITLGYVREIGRVLRPGGWAAFQVSNDPGVHRPVRGLAGLRLRALALLGRAPRGQRDPTWLGSAVELSAVRDAAADGGLTIERVVGAATQWCVVVVRKAP